MPELSVEAFQRSLLQQQQLADAVTNRNVWSNHYQLVDTSDLFQLQTTVARSVTTPAPRLTPK